MAISLSAARPTLPAHFGAFAPATRRTRESRPLLTKSLRSALAAVSISATGGPNPGGLAGQLFLAVDRSGGPTNNNIYMVASVQPTGCGTGTDVMFARSTDGGMTFSAPHRINDDPINHNKWHWFGTLAVAPNGRLDVCGWIRETLRITSIRSYSILTAPMVA